MMYVAPRGHARAHIAFVSVVLALSIAVPHPAWGTGDRIFADGFEPCCTLGGQVSGLVGEGLVLHLEAGGVDEAKPVAAGNGPLLYTFTHTVPAGTTYNINITTHPGGQSCVLSNPSGTMGGIPIENADVICGINLNWDDGSWDNAAWN